VLRFHASVVEVFVGDADQLTVHFDDEADHYLQLQVIPERDDEESARVYVEVDDQSHAGGDCFSLAELRRGSFRMVFAFEPRLLAFGEAEITFQLDDEVFGRLNEAMAEIFTGVTEYRAVSQDVA
jgi:hypothetical protein